VVEQAVPEAMEWDGLDEICVHVVALDEVGDAIATGRMTPDGRIGRMAVLRAWRGRGIGAAVLDRLIAEARQRGLAWCTCTHRPTRCRSMHARASWPGARNSTRQASRISR